MPGTGRAGRTVLIAFMPAYRLNGAYGCEPEEREMNLGAIAERFGWWPNGAVLPISTPVGKEAAFQRRTYNCYSDK